MFADSKPVVVVTHGDRLSTFERARVRVQLGELLGIPPTSQIFDIPGDISENLWYCWASEKVLSKLDVGANQITFSGVNAYDTELTILDMLRYCAEHADRNLPSKQNFLKEVGFFSFSMYVVTYTL